LAFCSSDKAFSFLIISVSGQIVGKEPFALHQAKADLNGLPSGLYLVRVEDEDGVSTQKLVVE